jgi:predicted DNA-binding protein
MDKKKMVEPSYPVRLEIRVGQEMADALAALTARTDRTMTAEVRRAIRDHLARYGLSRVVA